MSPTAPWLSTLLYRGSKFISLSALLVAVGLSSPACDSKDKASSDRADKNAAGAPKQAQNAAVLKALTDEDASESARLDSIHSARDLQLMDAIPALQELLKNDNADIVVAAAAALDGLDAPDTDLLLIEAAGHLGRARDFEHLRQLLYIIGNVGGPRARTYLETVAEGHELPPIQDTAAQVLKDMNAPPY